MGFVNEGSLFDPSLFSFKWEEDSLGRLTPRLSLLSDSTAEAKINTLHIHSKRTADFYSLRSRMAKQQCDDIYSSVQGYSEKQKIILANLYRLECTRSNRL